MLFSFPRAQTGTGAPNCEHSTLAGVPMVVLGGDLDVAAAPQLRSALQAIAASATAIVDLAEVSFLDSTAVGVVVRADQAARRRGGHLILTSPTRQVRKVFELLGLDTKLMIRRDAEDAVVHLRLEPCEWSVGHSPVRALNAPG